jgi:CheY-like chemotaxis protein
VEEVEHIILNDRIYVSNRKILIVDDEPFNIMAMEILIKMALQSLGMPVDIMETIIEKAYNGKQALEKVKQLHEQFITFGLILMDCSMPEMDGYTASLKIREFYSGKKKVQPYIVACTGHVENKYVNKAWDSQFNELIGKPAKIEQITQIIDECVKMIN